MKKVYMPNATWHELKLALMITAFSHLRSYLIMFVVFGFPVRSETYKLIFYIPAVSTATWKASVNVPLVFLLAVGQLIDKNFTVSLHIVVDVPEFTELYDHNQLTYRVITQLSEKLKLKMSFFLDGNQR